MDILHLKKNPSLAYFTMLSAIKKKGTNIQMFLHFLELKAMHNTQRWNAHPLAIEWKVSIGIESQKHFGEQQWWNLFCKSIEFDLISASTILHISSFVTFQLHLLYISTIFNIEKNILFIFLLWPIASFLCWNHESIVQISTRHWKNLI
jgi:hypothetical protein